MRKLSKKTLHKLMPLKNVSRQLKNAIYNYEANIKHETYKTIIEMFDFYVACRLTNSYGQIRSGSIGSKEEMIEKIKQHYDESFDKEMLINEILYERDEEDELYCD